MIISHLSLDRQGDFCLTPCCNKLIVQKKDLSTPDRYITRYRWLFIDSDPERPSGISSTDEEHELALAHSQTIREALRTQGWPEPIWADSGTGSTGVC